MEQLITKAKIRLPKTKILPGCSWVSDVLIVSVPRGIAILSFRQGPKAQIKYQTDCGFPCPLPSAEPRARHCPSLDTSCQALPSALHQQPLSQLTTPNPQIQFKRRCKCKLKTFCLVGISSLSTLCVHTLVARLHTNSTTNFILCWTGMLRSEMVQYHVGKYLGSLVFL